MAVKVNLKKCIGCGNCQGCCPVKAIKIESNKATISNDCVECGACVSLCPVGALHFKRPLLWGLLNRGR